MTDMNWLRDVLCPHAIGLAWLAMTNILSFCKERKQNHFENFDSSSQHSFACYCRGQILRSSESNLKKKLFKRIKTRSNKTDLNILQGMKMSAAIT